MAISNTDPLAYKTNLELRVDIARVMDFGQGEWSGYFKKEQRVSIAFAVLGIDPEEEDVDPEEWLSATAGLKLGRFFGVDVGENDHVFDREMLKCIHRAICPDPSSEPDGTGEYTNRTGDGYLGVYAVSHGRTSISYGTWEGYNWRIDDDLWVVDEDPGIVIVDDEPEAYISKAEVQVKGVGPVVNVPPVATEEILLSDCSHIRVYEYGEGGLRVVPVDPDPLVEDGGDNDAE